VTRATIHPVTPDLCYMSQAINPKGARKYLPGARPSDWVADYLGSSVGQKVLVAITGLSLTTFVLFHMIGNLKMFSGRDSINAYAEFLKHDLGVLIWVARAGLAGTLAIHLFTTIRLKLKTKAARPVGYFMQKTAQASPQSKLMLSTGLVTAAFIAFHLAHFTFGYVHDAGVDGGARVNYMDLKDDEGRHDVYSIVISGFSTPWISALYIVCQILLFLHLTHGIPSSLQTLGLVGRRFTPAARALGYGLATVVLLGNLAIIVAVWTGYLPPVSGLTRG